MKKYLFLTIFSFAFAMGCSSPNQPTTQGQMPSTSEKAAFQEMVEWTQTEWNPCCQTYITFTGRLNVIYKNDGSIYHLSAAQMIGTDELGNTYHGGAMESFKPQGPNGTGTHILVWTVTGNDCRYKFTIHYHVTIDENGNPHAVIDKYGIECL
jgi:hypothetical protein